MIPCCLNSSKSASSASLSFSFRLAVGSSRISSFTSFESALAISISCCFPTPRLVIRVSGFSLRPTLFEQRLGSLFGCVPVDDPVLGLFVAEENILGNR